MLKKVQEFDNHIVIITTTNYAYKYYLKLKFHKMVLYIKLIKNL